MNATSYLPESTRRLLQALAAFFGFFVCGQFALLLIAGEDVRTTTVPQQALATAIACFAAVGLALVWPPVHGVRPISGTLRTLLQCVAFFVAWTVVIAFGYLPLLRAYGVDVPPQPLVAWIAQPRALDATFVGVVLLVCTIGPIAEEIVFRGYVLGALTLRLGPWVALIATTLAFGLVHGLLYAVPTALLGLWFGWLAQRSGGRLWQPILAHVFHNSVVVTMTVAWPDSVTLLHDR